MDEDVLSRALWRQTFEIKDATSLLPFSWVNKHHRLFSSQSHVYQQRTELMCDVAFSTQKETLTTKKTPFHMRLGTGSCALSAVLVGSWYQALQRVREPLQEVVNTGKSFLTNQKLFDCCFWDPLKSSHLLQLKPDRHINAQNEWRRENNVAFCIFKFILLLWTLFIEKEADLTLSNFIYKKKKRPITSFCIPHLYLFKGESRCDRGDRLVWNQWDQGCNLSFVGFLDAEVKASGEKKKTVLRGKKMRRSLHPPLHFSDFSNKSLERLLWFGRRVSGLKTMDTQTSFCLPPQAPCLTLLLCSPGGGGRGRWWWWGVGGVIGVGGQISFC